MTQLNHTGNTAHAARYETPAFAPGSAFSWTLRSAEIARRGNDVDTVGAPRSDTPAFTPGSAFSWTRRSAEIARRRLAASLPIATAQALAA